MWIEGKPQVEEEPTMKKTGSISVVETRAAGGLADVEAGEWVQPEVAGTEELTMPRFFWYIFKKSLVLSSSWFLSKKETGRQTNKQTNRRSRPAANENNSQDEADLFLVSMSCGTKLREFWG